MVTVMKLGGPGGAFEQGNSRRKQVRQLAHDHAIPHCHRAIWATARRNNVALGAQTGGLGQENTQKYSG
jgi:hypothetical protein